MPPLTSLQPARPVIFWIATLALVVTAAVLLREVLLPFVAGMALAYLLDPLVNRLERLGLNRAPATLLILAAFFFGVIALLVFAIPIIATEIAILINKFPIYLKRLHAFAVDPSHPSFGKLVDAGIGEAEQSSGELAGLGAGWLGEFLRSLWSDGRALLSIFSLLVVTPIITAYLVYDWTRIMAALDNLVPAPQRHTVRTLAREIDATIAAFLLGQGAICLILGIFYALALRFIGLNHGLLIGIASGLLAFIPYFGSLTGLLLSLSVAIVQFGLVWTPILMVLGIFLVGQALADYVLAPWFVGSKVHLNPVWLMFSLFSFGYLFGFVGLLIAVPVAASIGVLVRFAFRQNQTGSSERQASAEFVSPKVDVATTSPRPPVP
jgi:predicted PurR-regulated permease PerM